MRFPGAVLACLGVCAVSGALADPPSNPPAQSAAAEPAAAATTSATEAATAKAPVTGPQSAATSSTTAAVDAAEKRLLAQGYKVQMRNGEKVFCHREQVIGSRLEGKLVCGTARELALTQQEAKDRIEGAQRQQTNRVYN